MLMFTMELAIEEHVLIKITYSPLAVLYVRVSNPSSTEDTAQMQIIIQTFTERGTQCGYFCTFNIKMQISLHWT